MDVDVEVDVVDVDVEDVVDVVDVEVVDVVEVVTVFYYYAMSHFHHSKRSNIKSAMNIPHDYCVQVSYSVKTFS